MAYGQKSNVGIIFQNSFGTAGDVNSIHFIPNLSENLKLEIPPLISENMRGVFDEGDSYEGAKMVNGDIDCEAQPIALGVMLKTILEETANVNSSGIYTRTFKPRVSDFDDKSANNPVTAYAYRDTGSAMLYSDLNGATLELGIANGEFLKAKVGFVGGTFSQNASVAASYPVGKRWTWDTTSVSIATSAMVDVVNMNIVVDDGGLEASHTLNGSKYPSRIKRTGNRTIKVDGTLKFADQLEYQEFLSQSERELIMTFTGPTQIQSGYYEVLQIQLPKLRYEEAAPMAEGVGYIEMSVTAKGKYSVDSGTSMIVTLINTQVAY
ncbi:hypothetical protein KAR91_47695 [Candidatus Pacearchaeota archaeon]|nr:hypothetical protein [Candidatus Pacearchaeota archaeon]